MDRQNSVCRFLKDERGATIVEFALVSTMFFMIFLGIIEYGLIMFTKVQIEGVTQSVSRYTGINDSGGTGCPDRVCVIKTLVQQNTHDLINANNVVVTSTVVSSPTTTTAPAEPDQCLDTPGVPYPATCTGGGGYINNDGVPGYQAASNNVGGANDLVQISVFYTWNVIFPLLKPLFPGGVVKMMSTTVVRNEPYN